MSNTTRANNIYYDIESLADIFTLAAYSEKDNHLYIWYLLEDTNIKFTAAEIRQIESKTMSKLRHPSRSQVLRDFLE